MGKFLKKNWFVVLVATLFIGVVGYYIYDTNKGKLKGKKANGEDVVYEITKSMWENISDITAIHATIAKEMTLEGACRSMVAELHPGAERYYQEVGLID